MSVEFILRPNEKLRIYRRRCGQSQPQLAEEYGVSEDTWRQWETGRRTWDLPTCGQVREVKPYERYYLLRTRKAMTQEALAKHIGVTRQWVHLMESNKAPCDRLAEFWEN